jgi:hypothetical protein
MFLRVSLVVFPEQNNLKWKQQSPPTANDKTARRISKNKIKDPKIKNMIIYYFDLN